jgi:hypothetical protein
MAKKLFALSPFQIPLGSETVPGKSGQIPVFSPKSKAGLSKSGALKPPLPERFFSKKPALSPFPRCSLILRIARTLLPAVLLWILPVPGHGETKPDILGFDLNVFNYHFGRADREFSPEQWMTEARRGIGLARSAWERLALELYDNPLLLEAAGKNLEDWSERELEERFTEWLVKRFFGAEAELRTGRINQEAGEASRRLVFQFDVDGNILYDENSGDPLVIRPGEEGRDIAADLALWRERTVSVVETEVEKFRAQIEKFFPELLRYVSGDRRADFENKLRLASLNAVSGLRSEFEGLVAREQRSFVARRTGDVWSLRKKSEDQAAGTITARLIEEAQALCSEGLTALEARIEAAQGGEGDLVLAGSAWLEAYREQFERGLRVWEEAEERFFVRRIEWEQDAGKHYLEGEEAWGAAFTAFEQERMNWEVKAKALFESGEMVFKKTSETLEAAIAEAKAEFEKDARIRSLSGAERAKAWVDMYITSGSIVAGAQENADFWLQRYGSRNPPRLSSSVFEEWIDNELIRYWQEIQEEYERHFNYQEDKEILEGFKELTELTYEEQEAKYLEAEREKESLEVEIERINNTLNNENSSLTQRQRRLLLENLEDYQNRRDELTALLSSLLPWVEDYEGAHQAAWADYETELAVFKDAHFLWYDAEDMIAGNYSSAVQNNTLDGFKEQGVFFSGNFNTALELKKWREIYNTYIGKALEARDALARDFGLVMGAGGLRDILDEGVSSEDFALDEYQIELIRAKAAAAYWEKRVAIAGAVAAYAEEVSAGRMTDGEGVKAWEEAKRAYDGAVALYESGQERLHTAGAETAEAQALLNKAAKKVQEADAKLGELNRAYAVLIAAYEAGRDDFIMEELAVKYKDLIKEQNILNLSGDEAAYMRFLERAYELGFAQEIERAGDLLKQLVAGSGGGDKSLRKLRAEAAGIIALNDDDALPHNLEDYGIPADNAYFTVIQQLLSERDRKAGESGDAGTRDAIIDKYDRLVRIMIRAAKEKAERAAEDRVQSLRLLTGDSTGAWYFAAVDHEPSDEELAAFNRTGLREQLAADLDQNRRALLAARLELELEALNYFTLGGTGSGAAELLSRFCQIGQTEALEGVNALEKLSDIIALWEGGSDENPAALLEKAAGEDPFIRWFIKGGSFFSAEFGSIISEAFLGGYTAPLDRSEGLLKAYYAAASQAPMTRNEMFSLALRGIQEVFISCGIESYDGYLPGMGAIGSALFEREGALENILPELLARLDEQFGELPSWINSEFERWKSSLTEYIAARMTYLGRTPESLSSHIKEMISQGEARSALAADVYEALSLYGPGSARALCAALSLDLGEFTILNRAMLEAEAVRRIGRELAGLYGAGDLNDEAFLREQLTAGTAQYHSYAGEEIREQAVEEGIRILRLSKALNTPNNSELLDGYEFDGYEKELYRTRRFLALGLGEPGENTVISRIFELAGAVQDPALRGLLFLRDELAAVFSFDADRDAMRAALYEEPAGGGLSWINGVYAREGADFGNVIKGLLDAALENENLSYYFFRDTLRAEAALMLESAALFINALGEEYGGMELIPERIMGMALALNTDKLPYFKTITEILGLNLADTPENIYELVRRDDFNCIRDALMFEYPAAGGGILFRLKYLLYTEDLAAYEKELEAYNNYYTSKYQDDPETLALKQAGIKKAEDFAWLLKSGRSYLGENLSGSIISWVLGRDSGSPEQKARLIELLYAGTWEDPFINGAEWGLSLDGAYDPYYEILKYELENLYAGIIKENDLLISRYSLISAWENINKTVTKAEQNGEKHWRGYITVEFLADYNNDVEEGGERLPAGTGGNPEGDYKELRTASGWEEGVLIDMFTAAERDAQKLSAALAMYGGESIFSGFEPFINEALKYLSDQEALWDENSKKEIPYMVYDNYYLEAEELQKRAAYEESLRREIEQLGRGYEASKSGMPALQEEMRKKSAEIAAREDEYNLLAEEYSEKAGQFALAGAAYDAVYNDIKELYNGMEETRFQYEIQDAIRRWASTAYLESGKGEDISGLPYSSPREDMVYSGERLARAGIALAALSSLYDENEERRPYEKAEYEALYEEYEKSFSRMLLTLKALNSVDGAVKEEVDKNTLAYNNYKYYMSLFAGEPEVSRSYVSPEDRSGWDIKDFLVVKNGKLGFSYDADFELRGVNASASAALADYINVSNRTGNETYALSQYEEALRKLSERLKSYAITEEKYRQWGLARDYLLRRLIGSNGEITGLEGYYHYAVILNEYQNLGEMPIKENMAGIFADTKVYERAGTFRNGLDAMQREAWASLSAAERSDLEFYLVLTLTGGGGYNTGAFARISEFAEIKNIRDQAVSRYEYLKWKAGDFFSGWLYKGARERLKATKNAIESPYNELSGKIRENFNGFNSILNNLNSAVVRYKQSCESLANLKGGKSGNNKIVWNDILSSLKAAGDLSAEDCSALKIYWDEMNGDINVSFLNVSDALTKLAQWGRTTKEDSRRELEQAWNNDELVRRDSEAEYRRLFDSFIDGKASAAVLKAAMKPAFGEKAPAWKNHMENLEQAIMNDLGGVVGDETVYILEYEILAEEYAELIGRAYTMRYAAELAGREAEWAQQRLDLKGKYDDWIKTSALILERGRNDWKSGSEKLAETYREWIKRYQEEYVRVSDNWAAAYYAGLKDKENWIAQTTEAAAGASSETLLALVGAGAEAMARAMDTKDPAGISLINGKEEAENTLKGLLAGAGIANLSGAFEALKNSAGTISGHMRRGIGGPNVWDSGIIHLEAAGLAKEINAELAAGEAKKIAAMTRTIMAEVIQNLTDSVNQANGSFHDSMDNTFIIDGQWKRSGKNYIKDVIVHSTFFEPVITRRVEIEGYEDYRMGPVAITVDLSENRLQGLDSMAIQGLLKNLYSEVTAISERIFGTEEDQSEEAREGRKVTVERYKTSARLVTRTITDLDETGREVEFEILVPEKYEEYVDTEYRFTEAGEFGEHIGYYPVMKVNAGADDDINSLFLDSGTGELGRLMARFYYWSIQEGRGIHAISMAQWDKPLWDSRDSWFQAPSVRQVADIGLQAATMAVGIAATPFTGGMSFIGAVALNTAINASDDLAFAALDTAGGFKDIREAGFEFGKKTLISAASSALGGVFNGLPGVSGGISGAGGINGLIAGEAGLGIGKALTQTVMTSMQAVTTNLAAGVLGAVTYTVQDGFGFSNRALNAGIIGNAEGGIGSMAGTFTTGLMNTGLTGFIGQIYADGAGLSALIGGAAEQGINYATGGDINLNVLNAGLFTGGKINLGLMELKLGRDGAGMSLGTGGLDVSAGTIAGAVRGLEAWTVNIALLKAGEQAARTYMSQMRTLYSFDKATKAEYEAILTGKTKILETGDAGKAQSVYDEITGIKTVRLGGGALNDGSGLGLNVLFVHEAYRDGKDNGVSGQTTERNQAVAAHIEAARQLMNIYGMGNMNIRDAYEVKLYDYARRNNNGLLMTALFEDYDTSGDFWKLISMSNGAHKIVWDKKKTLTIEYLNDKGEAVSSLAPEEQNVSGMGMAASLANIIGLDRARQILGAELDNAGTYDFQTLKDVLGLSDEAVKEIQAGGKLPSNLTENQKLSLAGEALMKRGGAVWDGKNWINTGSIALTLTDRNLYNQGRIIANVNKNGGFDYSTVATLILRDIHSYLGWSTHEGDKFNLSMQGLDSVVISQYDLNGKLMKAKSFAQFHTVDNMTKNSAGKNLNQPYHSDIYGDVQGNTIAPGSFGMTYYSTSGGYPGRIGGVNNAVLVINNAKTIAGTIIDNNGHGGTDALRWLMHANGMIVTENGKETAASYNSYFSDGCFVSPVPVIQNMFDFMASLGMQQGYQIDTTLKEFRPGEDINPSLLSSREAKSPIRGGSRLWAVKKQIFPTSMLLDSY